MKEGLKQGQYREEVSLLFLFLKVPNSALEQRN